MSQTQVEHSSSPSIELTTDPRSTTKDESTQVPDDTAATPAELALGRRSTAAIFFSIIFVNGISTLLNGLVTVALPKMVRDLDIPPSLMLWPASIYALTCGCSLILSGALADALGSRFMYILGTLLQSAFTLGCGLSQNPFQLIFFRGLAGIAIAFCLPSAVSLITTYFPHGRRRNMAFALMGGGQPVGFSIGLTVGGLLVDSSATWRAGFYVCAGINTIVLVVTFFGLPKITRQTSISWSGLWRDVDWTGAVILSASLGMLSYVLAALTGSITTIHQPATIALLSAGLAMLPAFAFWVGRQERRGQPAIIPNSLWKNAVFTSICIDVFLLWGAFNATENLLTFFFQDVQNLSAVQASIRFLPMPVMGLSLNLAMGLFIHKLRANWAIIIGSLIGCVSPILTAVMDRHDPYWEYAFPAIALGAIGPDVLFTASNLVITDAFPSKTQALAGGVFNTVAQIGKSVGIAVAAVIANSISRKMEDAGESREMVLLDGYRAAWWFCLAITAATILVSLVGLRNIGKLGVKRD